MGSPRLHPHPHGRPAGPGSLPPDKIQAQNDITARLGIKPNRTGKSTELHKWAARWMGSTNAGKTDAARRRINRRLPLSGAGDAFFPQAR